MIELGFDISRGLVWFPHERDTPYVLVRVSEADARSWAVALGVSVRRCYVTDALLDERARASSVPKSEILSAKLPDPGATMAGDFGEILVYLYQAAKEHPKIAFGPKKWRLKQDRTKPAPHSDVIHFLLPTWPQSSTDDVLICSEVKTKSTNGTSTPIASAIEDSGKDRTSRLARTLVWLRERALVEDFGTVKLEHLDRFINATEHPAAKKRFCAVAVLCSSVVEGELRHAPTETPTDYTLIVIVVPELHSTYNSVFDAARDSERPPVPSGSAGSSP